MSEREPFELPIINKPVPRHVTFIKKNALLCIALAKKAAIASLQGAPVDLNEEIEKVLLSVNENGYSRGLKAMDKMHRK